MNKETILQVTEDGSHTLYLPQLDETYHSTHGSIQEANVVFIKNAFLACKKEEVSLLEIGFGTGLNAFLTLLELNKTDRIKQLNYTSIELYPVSLVDALQLNYADVVEGGDAATFEALHKAAWDKTVAINNRFNLHKIASDFTTFEFNQKYDAIYFDAFGPDKQAEMWEDGLFEKLFEAANENAIITTYSAKGSVRRAMQKAGFTMERLPGPIGKREVLRGRKLI